MFSHPLNCHYQHGAHYRGTRPLRWHCNHNYHARLTMLAGDVAGEIIGMQETNLEMPPGCKNINQGGKLTMLGFTLVALAFDFSLDNACEHESLTRFPLCQQTLAARLPEATVLADTTRRKLLHILATPTVNLLRTVQDKKAWREREDTWGGQ